MKKIFFLLALLLCFTACSGQQSVNSDVSSDTAIENEEKQVDNYLAGNVNVLKGVLPDTLKKNGFSIQQCLYQRRNYVIL